MGNQIDRGVNNLVFSPPIAGCVLFLPGLPEGGSKLHDRSPYGTPGTITGATWSKAPGGFSCLHFDGINDYVKVTPCPQLHIAGAITLSLWVYHARLVNYQLLIGMDRWAGGVGYANYSLYSKSGGELLFQFGQSSGGGGWYTTISSGAGLVTNKWQHITLTFDEATDLVSYYVDGQLKDTDIQTASMVVNAANSLSIGTDMAGSGSSSWWLQGDLALERISNTCLTSQLEIQDYFERTKRFFGRV